MKPFTVSGRGLAINVFNISSGTCIPNAPVKGQCAKDYIYGENLELERHLQVIENMYGLIISKALRDIHSIDANDTESLRAFSYLQYCRTDMAMNRMRMMQEGLHRTIHDGRDLQKPDLDLSDRAMMRDAIRQFSSTYSVISDLKSCIIINNTEADFVTSDDPAVFTSRFYAQKIKSNTYGIGSAGALLFLPLTPKHMFMLYDGGVYTLPEKNGKTIVADSDQDILALNQLQYIKADKNIYFSEWGCRQKIQSDFLDIVEHRKEHSVDFRVYIPVSSNPYRINYRLATEEERRTSRNSLVQSTTYQPAPPNWFSKLRYRSKIKAYTNKSAAGWVREAIWRNRFSDLKPTKY